MKVSHTIPYSLFCFFILFIILQIIPIAKSSLKCEPDFKSKGDDFPKINNPPENNEYLYGYEFAHKIGEEYYDHWKGVYWDNESFCYDAYDSFFNSSSSTVLKDYEISEFDVVSNLNDIQNKESYILIEHEQSNLINFHKNVCVTKLHNISNISDYNNDVYELFIKMDNTFQEDFLNKPHYFYFTIENPSNETVIFSFKTRNYKSYIKAYSDVIEEWGPNMSQCIEETEITERKEDTIDMKTDIKTDIITNMKTDIETDIITDIKSNMITDIKSDMKTDIMTDIITNMKTDIKTDMKTDKITDMKSDIKSDIISDIITDMKTDMKTDIITNLKTDMESDINRDTITIESDISKENEELGNETEKVTSSTIKPSEDLSIQTEKVKETTIKSSEVPSIQTEKVKETTKPCERDIILLNQTFINWTEEYPDPEIFYLTNNYTIQPHSSMNVKIDLTFKKNNVESEGGYFIISPKTGESNKPFYWPGNTKYNGKLKKYTNMEIILESNYSIGLSSFSLMRDRENEAESFLGTKCNVKNNNNILNGKCGDGYSCNQEINGDKCMKCNRKECKKCDSNPDICTECFLISVDGQWNPPGGKNSEGLNCDLDYIDITKAKINNQQRIEVPPAIHWRVTMDFWIWISDTSVLSDAKINMNIVYKDFIAMTLRCFPEGLTIFATPLEWYYEYPTCNEKDNDTDYYQDNVKPYIRYDIVKFLKEKVGSYGEVTLEDLIKNADSNWVYIRYAFNLDSSKHYLNDLPENNLKVSQIYTDQTKMPFHMKKFYGKNKMTYLYFHNFYDPLTEQQKAENKKINIYFRNFNIFREYIPQNIITKYYNLHLIDSPLKFPQLLISFPFSNLSLSSNNIYKMKVYNYYIREDDGKVSENEIEIKEYNLILDNDLLTLRPPRNFWRLNFLELNKQPETCDLDKMIELKCDNPNEVCFEDNKAFICIEGTDDKPYYLDINNFECNNYCPIGYMHPPRYSLSKQRLYCSHLCDTGSKQCPSDDYKYMDIHSNFLCQNNFFNLYYKCFNKDEDFTKVDYTGIFFSTFLNTPSIYIDLPKKYEEFAIEFWFFPDYRLRYKRYLDREPDKNYDFRVISESEKNRIIFLSDCCKVVHGSTNNDVLSFYVNKVAQSTYNYQLLSIQKYNWNHFFLSYFKRSAGAYNYYLAYKNDYYNYVNYNTNNIITYNYWTAPSGVTLSKIIFCTMDDNDNIDDYLKSVCKSAKWLDGFYRKLQIFDLKYSARQSIQYSYQFEDDGLNGLLKHRYIFGLSSVVDNRLIDLIGNSDGYVITPYNALSYQNPDGANYILYETNYDPQWGISSFVSNRYITNIEFKVPKLSISSSTTSNINNCLISQSSSVCISCKEGFTLFNKLCKGNEKSNSKSGTYYYKNPGKNMPERISLNLNFNKIINEPSFTIFFFIKIYGFVKNAPEEGPVKILIFHQEKNKDGKLEDNFYLGWDPSERQKLFFYLDGQILFSINDFREIFFGIWVPISFTAFREQDRRFKMNMAQASVHMYNLAKDSSYNNPNDLFPYVKFTQFSITNRWVGLLSDIKIYNKFIINAWGIIQHQHQSFYSLGDPIEEINLKSDFSDSCLLSNQILNKPSLGYKQECIPDYNPYFVNECTSKYSFNYVSNTQTSSCATCCNSGSYPTNCIYGPFVCGLSNEYYSCETSVPFWKTYFPLYSSSKQIICMRLQYIDYNRYKFARANDVESPQDVWAIDFWFKTSTNQAVKEISKINLLTDKKADNNNNFNEFIIEWNYHNRIRVFKEVLSEQENTFTYKVECTPLIVTDHPELSSPETYVKNLGDVHYEWTYVACGINFQEKNFYLTDNNQFTTEKSFSSKLYLIPSDKTTLSITENSPLGYGFTFIYQLRLWHCYNCAQNYKNIEYQADNTNFNAVYHDFDGTISNKVNDTYQEFADKANNCKTTLMVQAANFPGYTLNFDPGQSTICDENIFEYYNEKSKKCERHFNLARLGEEKSKDIPSSRNGRYTIDFWFFIEKSENLVQGTNIIWENHLSITLIRDILNTYTINAICFPQSYINNVNGKSGQDILDLYDQALNKDKYSFYQSSSMWNFVRCAVDQTRKRFFINDNLELDLEGEILYGTTKNYRPFRYFNIKKNSRFILQNANLNPTRIFLRQIKCYRDYIDFRLMDLKYIACAINNDYLGRWYNPCRFYPLSFCFDYGEMISANWRNCDSTRSCFYCSGYSDCGLVYLTFDESNDNTFSVTRHYWTDLLTGDVLQFYSTFPDIYHPYFCDHGQLGGDKEPCTGAVRNCKIRNGYFWPDSENTYIELNTLTKVSKCENACRPPDGYYTRNYCLIEQNSGNMISCALNFANKNTYSGLYECKPGYVKVYYECIDEKLIQNSAMYFSNVYSFPNVVFSPADKTIENMDYLDWKEETRIASYYLEIWIKFDALNNKKDNPEVEYYLYAHPHQIIKDPEDKKYKYSNKLISKGFYFYNLESIHNYEWNKIIIENLYDRNTKLFSIKLYINDDFENPELSIEDLHSSLYKLHFRGFGFCDEVDNVYCKINDEPVYIRWGSAWYRNFRVWDAETTSLNVIKSCEYDYSQLINSQIYYFPLTIDTIEKNTIKDKINPEKNKLRLNYWFFYTGNDYIEAFDNDMRENYSTDNFDKTYINENNYISGINDDGTDYSLSSCSSECKRCYSSLNGNCYECRRGYSLYGKYCKINTGFFLKTPPSNNEITEIEIASTNDNTKFSLEKANPLTITLYIKFFGIERDKIIEGKIYYILVCFYKDASNFNNCVTFIGYNYDNRTIVFVVNDKEVYSSKAKDYLGVWTHFGISIHRSNNNYFPNMLNFMIDQQVLIPYTGFDPKKEEVNINTFTIYTDPVAMYSSFKVFSTFYFGSYGHVNAISFMRRIKLLYQVNLYGTSKLNCLTNADLAQYPSLSISSLIPECVSDYLPYEDVNNECFDNEHFMDVVYKQTPPCELCDSQCITNCYGLESSECTCDYYEGLYWVKTDKDYQSYECQRVDSINFAFFQSVNIYGINIVSNDEMGITFWLNIYEYLDNNFESLEIIWNQHLAVIITGNGEQGDNKSLIIECNGDYDITNPNIGQKKVYDRDRLKFNKWNYIVCQADKFHKLIRVNDLEEQEYHSVTYSQRLLTGSLRVRDSTTNFNYGFSFVRELKLFSSYNFDFWDESHHNIKKENFGYLLHYFHNDFQEKKLEDTKMIDQIQGSSTKLNLKSDRIGYNYVIDYENLIICNEGYIYDNSTKTCKIYNSMNCSIPRNDEDKCLLCSSFQKYLNKDDKCTDNCENFYYGDDYFRQCRKCDDTCFTCFGKYYNNCLSCTGNLFYIEAYHICITNCHDYGLIQSDKKSNSCEELIVETYISYPVNLDNTYDYNPLNEDFSSKVINKNILNRIEGNIRFSSADINYRWSYNWEETIDLNKNHKFYDVMDFPETNPITSEASKLTIYLNNDYFKDGYKYLFDLIITLKKGNVEIELIHKYIIMINDYPEIGNITIVPSKGYINNKFLISITNCKDDITKSSSLQYKFSYFKTKYDIKMGHEESSEEEILIQDWSSDSEVLYQFQELNPKEAGKYYIRGYCKDKYDLYDSIIQEVEAIEIPTSGNINLNLTETIKSLDINDDLTLEQLLNRAEFFATVTSDFDKGIEIINRTNITDFSKKGMLQEKLILNDPVSSSRDIYCNYRGNSYVIYFYLICECNDYFGNMCQIDKNSFESMIEIYYKLFYKLKIMQGNFYHHDLIKAIYILMKSGAAFMEIENIDFMLNSIDIIDIYMNKFPSDMLKRNNYEVFFDIYNSLIEYGFTMINKLKYKEFIKNNIKNSENLYNAALIRNATLSNKDSITIRNYFDKMKFGLQNLLDFYTKNKKEIKYINTNMNVYIAIITEEFDEGHYFRTEKNTYAPYFEFKRCLENTISKTQYNENNILIYKILLSLIIWKVNPFMYSEELYWDTTSPIISFKFLNYDTGEKIYLSDCGSINNQIQLYFPVNNYNLVKTINNRRQYLSPENQYKINDDIIRDPVYINSSGAVVGLSVEERREKYFLGFNFSCKSYLASSEDRYNFKLVKDNLEFYKYTKDNYIKCLLNRLMQDSFEEFVIEYEMISSDLPINSRFFYLKHYQILSWKDNYTNNFIFYYFIILFAIYLVLSITYYFLEKKNFAKKQRNAELKAEIARINLPYRGDYIFNADLLMDEYTKSKLKLRRQQNFENMNLDINNINVEVMADEITKSDVGIKTNENNSKFNPNFFGLKDIVGKNINNKFFKKDNDIPSNIKEYNDELKPEILNKMKKFYQVGFKGLDNKEKIQKELKLSQDKRSIKINKKELDEISEISDEEEDNDIRNNQANFFENDSDKSSQEKETKIMRLTNKKKFNPNLKKYQNYISNEEDIDSKSRLRDSNRETTTKNFFNPNPPKKQLANSKSLILDSKDQQKVAKKNALFFADGSKGLIKNTNKGKNIFQKDYDDIYKPKFKGPKVIGENLGFYNNDTEYFEQDLDNENKKPPYFGNKPPEEKKDKKDNKIEKIDKKFGFYYKTSQLDFTDNGDKLPPLSEDLTFEKRLEEFGEISVSLKRFLFKNIFSRYILITTFSKMSIVYSKYMRAGNFISQLSLYALFLSIFFTNDEKQAAYETKEKSQIINFFLYCFLSDVLGNILVHIPAYCFWLNEQKLRKLYNIIRVESGITMMKQIDNIINRGRFFWNVLGVLIQIIFTFAGFYFSFGFWVTYYYQRNTFLLAIVITCGIDFIFTEFFWEIIIGLLFYFRDIGRIILILGMIFNRLRNIKHLV